MSLLECFLPLLAMMKSPMWIQFSVHETFVNLAVFISSGGQLRVEEQNLILYVPLFSVAAIQGCGNPDLLTPCKLLSVWQLEVWALRLINFLKYSFSTCGKGCPALCFISQQLWSWVTGRSSHVVFASSAVPTSTGTGEGCRTSCYFAVLWNGD